MPGRVGDSPLPGCGTYANNDSVAISCTGIGEAFVKEVAAHQVSDRVLYAKEDPVEAAKAALDGVARHHGDGGMIVVPRPWRRCDGVQQRDDELRLEVPEGQLRAELTP